jgi:hypothetical protein
MKKIVFSIILMFFILNSFSFVNAAVGIGMGPSRLTLEATVGESYSFDIVVFNPGDYDVKAKLNVNCKTCLSNFTLFEWKIADVNEDYQQFFRFVPDDVYIKNHTNLDSGVGITVHVTPSIWIKKDLIFTTPESINFLVRLINPGYTGKFGIPYYTLLIDDKNIKAQISASSYWSTFGAMGTVAAVGAPLDLHIVGMPMGSLIILIFIVLLIISLILVVLFKKTSLFRKLKNKIKYKRKE